MKLLLTLTAVFFYSFVFAQRPTIDKEVITYKEKTYKVGDTLHLGYGSANDKTFAFIHMGSGLGGFSPLGANWAKSDIVIDKVYKMQNKFMVRGKILEASTFGAKVIINIEGAIDNGELK
jgi:hypothetical protein